MDSDNLVSSVNPANLKSFAGTMKEILRFHDIKQDTCLPAQVVSFDRTTHLAKVQILVQHVYSSSDGVKYESGDVMEIPVLRLLHGLFLADAPLYPGDTGYVVAGHRDGTLAVEGNSKPVLEAGEDGKARTNNLGPQPPNTYLLHRYENGFFVPCRWGTVEVDEKDKDSLVLARYRNKTKEIERDGKKVEVYDGVEGKVTLEKDGTVRIVNGTGEIIESDEYRQAEEGETPDKTDANGVGWKKKPTVYIDPTADLKKTDARFREIIAMTKETDTESGKSRFVYKTHRILADEGEENVTDLNLGAGTFSAYFTIYQKEDFTFSIRKGMVCVNNDEFLDVEEPEDPLDPEKEYYCCVTIPRNRCTIAGAIIVAFDKIKQKEGEKDEKYQERRITEMHEQFEEYSPEDFDTCFRWIVPIGSIDEEGNITQNHVGAINLSSDTKVIPDFKIFVSGYDTDAKEYKFSIASGQVFANGGRVVAEGVDEIEYDTEYWCKATYTVASSSLAAEIVDEEPAYPGDDATIVWKVKIGKVTTDTIVQNHIGSVSFSLPNHTLTYDEEVVTKFFGTKDVDIHSLDTQYWPCFSCRWKLDEGKKFATESTECEFFLPDHDSSSEEADDSYGSAYFNGVRVDFSTGFRATVGDWKQPTDSISYSGIVYCWIGQDYEAEEPTYNGHLSNAAKEIGSKDEDSEENVVACFPVCYIDDSAKSDYAPVTENISQIASGEMLFDDHFDFPFKVEKIADTWEIYLPEGSVVRLFKSESEGEEGKIKMEALDLDDEAMAAAPSGRDDWYEFPDEVEEGDEIYAEFEQDAESEEGGSGSGKPKRNFKQYKIVLEPSESKPSMKVAKIIGGKMNEVTQYVSSALVLKEDSPCVESIIGETSSSVKIDGNVKFKGTLDGASGAEGTSCGIEFESVAATSAAEGAAAKPAHVIAKIKDRDSSEENWKAHALTFPDSSSSGGTKTIHFLGSEDATITGSSPSDLTQYWPSFSCKWGASSGCEFFLPVGSAYFNGVAVDFTTDFNAVVSGSDWKKPKAETFLYSGTIYCWIGEMVSSLGNYYGHLSNEAKTIGSKVTTTGSENVVACFPVCNIGNKGTTLTSGIAQIASGEMLFDDHFNFPFKVEKIADKWEIYLPQWSVYRLYKSADAQDNGKIKIENLALDGSMAGAESGRSGWYQVPSGANQSLYVEFQQESSGGNYKSNFSSYKIVATQTSGAPCTKVAEFVGGPMNEVTQIVSSSIVLKEDSPCVDTVKGDLATSAKINGDVVFTGNQNGNTGTSCGIEFLSIVGQSASGESAEIPPYVVARIKNRDTSQSNWGAHKITYKDASGTSRYVSFLGSGDVDSSITGKLIDYVELSQSSESGGFNIVVFHYTDGTSTTVKIQNGIDGQPGMTPEITGDKYKTHNYIYADGVLIATIEDGVSPVITANKVGKETKIFSNGLQIGSILDGEDGVTPEITASRISSNETAIYVNGLQIAVIRDGISPVITMGQGSGSPKTYPIFSNGVQIGAVHDGADGSITEPITEQEFITDINFSKKDNQIIATLTKKKGKIIGLTDLSPVEKPVTTLSTENVVIKSYYETSTRTFYNDQKNVVVISSGTATSTDVFTATPHDTSQ